MKKTITSKTVYILGAGFSVAGEVPVQRQILKKVFDLDIDILSGPDLDLVTNEVLPNKQLVEKFLKRIFTSNATPPLEDVFTLLDQSIAKRNYCLGDTWRSLDNTRDALKRLILILFHNAINKYAEKKDDFYRRFAAYLIIERMKAGLRKDPFSIISLNWDSLVESSIEHCLVSVNGHRKIGVDFCCYSSKVGKRAKHIPSILQRAKRVYNIKLLKLHGSTNWLLCPNCEKLFTGLGSTENVWELYVKKRICTHCNKFNKDMKPILESFIITPTFLKIFDNTHIQSVWNNAYVELSEANKIVFIGYSLPEADYHFRTLVRRAVNPAVVIDVVLRGSDRPPHKISEDLKRCFAVTRYIDFFGKDRIKFHYGGVEKYFDNILGGKSLKSQLNQIRKLI